MGFGHEKPGCAIGLFRCRQNKTRQRGLSSIVLKIEAQMDTDRKWKKICVYLWLKEWISRSRNFFRQKTDEKVEGEAEPMTRGCR